MGDFNFGNLTKYTDELSLELIAKAVLTTDLMNEIDVRSGLSAGTVAINLMDGDLTVNDLTCGWNEAGSINFSQVDIVIADKQVKMDLCPDQLREYYMSQRMTASAHAEEVPFEETIAQYYIDRIKKYNEGFLINGDIAGGGTTKGIKQLIQDAVAAADASSPTVPAGAAAWTVANAIDQALDLYDAIDEAVKDRDDLVMVVGPSNYRTLTRALVAQGETGLFHYKSVEGNEILMLPGTNIKVVKSSGLVNSDFVVAGPASFIVAGTGLENDASSMSFFWDKGADVVKFLAKWRLGVAVHQTNVFATNDLA